MDISGLISWLIESDIVDRETIVSDGVGIEDCSRRNSNFVVRAGERALFIKVGVGEETSGTIDHEIDFYEMTKSADFGTLHDYLPELVHFDRENAILVLELMVESPNLRDVISRDGPLTDDIGRAVAKALSALHRATSPEMRPAVDWSKFNLSFPFPLRIHRPSPLMLTRMSGANFELVHLLQQQQRLCEEADRLRAEWRPQCLIHTDIRWENILLCPSSESTSLPTAKIVDWELASLGYAIWDVGTVFGDLVYMWVSSMPFGSGLDRAAQTEMSRYPIEKIGPFASAFWNQYKTDCKIEDNESTEVLRDSIQFSGLRLIQRGFERLHLQSELSSDAVTFLQLSANILDRPLEAGVYLLGLEV